MLSKIMSEPFLEPILRWMRLQRVVSRIAPNSTVLDVGCGRAAVFLKAIAPRIAQGFGVDFKVDTVEFKNIKTLQFKFDGSLPFADASFDVVTMLAVLEHIEHEHQILQEIHRVLKPDGKLIITVPSIWAQPILEFLAYKLKIVSEAEIKDHKRYYNRQKLRKVLVGETNFRSFHHQYFQLWMNNFCTVVK
ncbi:class I SAM-dependent methyltransferase [Trichocoleus desertorum AS-A10]|uniref:class I SAM-dependent methyltransferase n=1 Tax=Trichocoleus desertorum TaxID=1481672 RepID=UPI003299FBA0